MNRPSRVFLNHSRQDKPLVRRYKQILGVLGFDVWLDEDAMPAGAKLERSLLKGFEESSAVIFFITPNFKDEKHLETEIDYAIKQKRKKCRVAFKTGKSVRAKLERSEDRAMEQHDGFVFWV